MSTRVKICGITTHDALDACVSHGAAFIGFVFHAASPRNIAPQHAALLASRLPSSVRSVAVKVNPDDAFLDNQLAHFRPDFIQLHGDETPARAHNIFDKYAVPIIKALRVGCAEDLKPAGDFTASAQMLLLDAKISDPSVMGGTGQAFDWSLLKNFAPSLPWFLSGGLHEGNIARAISETNARYLDISSGVESSKGVKDNAKISALLERINTLG